jgi:hypothetical protein
MIAGMNEEERVEVWNMNQFVKLGFRDFEVGALLGWGVDPHDAEALLWRNGERTRCTHEQALEILKPLEVVECPTSTS